MPVAISVRHDFRRFGDALDALGRRQLPYAAALALNATARAAAAEVTRELPAIFDRPTPFTRRAIGVQGARKSNLAARIFVKRAQARYLGIEEEGGTRQWAPGAPILVPVDQRSNAYGNLPRGLVRRLLASPGRYFIGRVKGVYGLWERWQDEDARGRRTHRLKLLAAFRERAHWAPRFGFHQRVGTSVGRSFLPALSQGLAQAIATAIRR